MARLDICFYSCILKRDVNFILIYPSLACGNAGDYRENFYQDNKENKFPLLLLFHGYGGNYMAYERFSKIDMYAEENNIAVCMISGENKSYLNKGSSDNFYDFIETELKDYLYGNFNISPKKEDNFIAGLSMGGFGALYHGLSNPDAYAEIGAFSPGITMRRINKNKESTLKSLVIKNKNNLPRIYISCGEKDNIVKDEVEDFILFLKKKYIHFDYKWYKNYDHEWRLWDKEIENFIKKIKRTDYYKNSKKNV